MPTSSLNVYTSLFPPKSTKPYLTYINPKKTNNAETEPSGSQTKIMSHCPCHLLDIFGLLATNAAETSSNSITQTMTAGGVVATKISAV